jgi:hypothetical protein
MQWLVHGTISAAVSEALVEHGHVAHPVAEVDAAPELPAERILQIAAEKQWDILTDDPAVARMPFEQSTKFNRSLVVLQVEGESEQIDAVGRLFARYARLSPGRLYTVTKSRVKIRQLPTKLKV